MTTETTTSGDWPATSRERVLDLIEKAVIRAADEGRMALDPSGAALSLLEAIEADVEVAVVFSDEAEDDLVEATEGDIGAYLERRPGGVGIIPITADDEAYIARG